MLSQFLRRILGPASFPRRVGQGLPDPAERVEEARRLPDPEDRLRTLRGEAPKRTEEP